MPFIAWKIFRTACLLIYPPTLMFAGEASSAVWAENISRSSLSKYYFDFQKKGRRKLPSFMLAPVLESDLKSKLDTSESSISDKTLTPEKFLEFGSGTSLEPFFPGALVIINSETAHTPSIKLDSHTLVDQDALRHTTRFQEVYTPSPVESWYSPLPVDSSQSSQNEVIASVLPSKFEEISTDMATPLPSPDPILLETVPPNDEFYTPAPVGTPEPILIYTPAPEPIITADPTPVPVVVTEDSTPVPVIITNNPTPIEATDPPVEYCKVGGENCNNDGECCDNLLCNSEGNECIESNMLEPTPAPTDEITPTPSKIENELKLTFLPTAIATEAPILLMTSSTIEPDGSSAMSFQPTALPFDSYNTRIPTSVPVSILVNPTFSPISMSEMPTFSPTGRLEAPTVSPTIISVAPTVLPSSVSEAPTVFPTVISVAPTVFPSSVSEAPTDLPTGISVAPTNVPISLSVAPTNAPVSISVAPTSAPISVSAAPTLTPTGISVAPTNAPTSISVAPTVTPTGISVAPTNAPTSISVAPTVTPTSISVTPTNAPTSISVAPTVTPTSISVAPTNAPTSISVAPTVTPTGISVAPTSAPISVSAAPTLTPTGISVAPTNAPTSISMAPTVTPTGISVAPTNAPTSISVAPTVTPTGISVAPTNAPTSISVASTVTPTSISVAPTNAPTSISVAPTVTPTSISVAPTNAPVSISMAPTVTPTGISVAPTNAPTSISVAPTVTPTGISVTPTNAPTSISVAPTVTPTSISVAPTNAPTSISVAPTVTPTSISVTPTNAPTSISVAPTVTPTSISVAPTNAPTYISVAPTVIPTGISVAPTVTPTGISVTPTNAPTSISVAPTVTPTSISVAPTNAPVSISVAPTVTPTGIPVASTVTPTSISVAPTNAPVSVSVAPTVMPTSVSVVPTNAPIGISITPTSEPTYSSILPTSAPINTYILPTLRPTAVSALPTLSPSPMSIISTALPSDASFEFTISPSGILIPTSISPITLYPTTPPADMPTPSSSPLAQEDPTSSPLTMSMGEYTPAPTRWITPQPSIVIQHDINTRAPVAVYTPGGKDLGTVDVKKLKSNWERQDNTDFDSNSKQCLVSEGGITYMAGKAGNAVRRKLADSDEGNICIDALSSDNGDALWSVCYGTDEYDVAYDMYASNGRIIVVGSTNGNWFNEAGTTSDMIVLQLDGSTGNIMTGYQLSLSEGNDIALSLGVLNSNLNSDAIIGGTADNVAFVGRYSFNGRQKWMIVGDEKTIATIALYVDPTSSGAITALQSSIIPGLTLAELIDDTQKTVVQRMTSNLGTPVWSNELELGVGLAMAVNRNYNIVVAGFEGSNIMANAMNYTNAAGIWTYSDRPGIANAVALSTSSGHAIIVGSAPTEAKGRTDMDAFVLALHKDTGEELCYYSFGSTENDAATGIVYESELNITVSGTTGGDMFGNSLASSHVFAISLNQAILCGFEPSTAPSLFKSVAVSTTVATSVNTATILSTGGVVVTGLVTPATILSASTGFQVGSSLTAGGTMAALIFAQMQFMATTSLIDAHQTPQFHEFTDNIAWVNLWWSADVLLSSNSCAAQDESGVGGPVFIGNTVMVIGITFVLFILHVLVVSAVEGYWLAVDNARHRRRQSKFPLNITEDIHTHNAVQAPRTDDQITVVSARNEPAVPPRFTHRVHFNEELDTPADHVRRRSRSVWLHFPHVELLFLLYAYEGAVGAQASMLASPCIGLVLLASILLFLYPCLLFYLAYRVIHALIIGAAIFVPRTTQQVYGDPSDLKGCFRPFSVVRSIWKATYEGVRTGKSMFLYADKGHWRVPHTIADDKKILSRESFMRAYEPVYRDFTGIGAYYMLIILLRLVITSVIAALVDNGAYASLALCVVYGVNLIISVLWHPFSNSFLQFAENSSLFVNIFCLGIMWVQSENMTDRTSNDIMYGIFMFLQCVNIFVLILPIYLDMIIICIANISKKFAKSKNPSSQCSDDAGVDVSKRDILRYWRIMIGYNAVAMIHSLREGVSAVDMAPSKFSPKNLENNDTDQLRNKFFQCHSSNFHEAELKVENLSPLSCENSVEQRTKSRAIEITRERLRNTLPGLGIERSASEISMDALKKSSSFKSLPQRPAIRSGVSISQPRDVQILGLKAGMSQFIFHPVVNESRARPSDDSVDINRSNGSSLKDRKSSL